MFRARLVSLAVVAALGLQALILVPTALGASATEAQNPDISVSLSVPDTASVGETVAATVSFTNNSPSFQSITVRGVWKDPTGDETVTTRSALLFPGQTVTRVVDYTVDARSVPGQHEVSVTVETHTGASTAATVVQVI
jgi:hypothetical protein